MSKDSDTTDGRPETAGEAEEGSGQPDADVPREENPDADVPRDNHPDVDIPGGPDSGADGSGESDAGSDDAPAQEIDRLGSDVEVEAEIDEEVATFAGTVTSIDGFSLAAHGHNQVTALIEYTA